MSLLLDALKRAEEAKRAKQSAESGIPQVVDSAQAPAPQVAVTKSAGTLSEMQLEDYKDAIAPRVPAQSIQAKREAVLAPVPSALALESVQTPPPSRGEIPGALFSEHARPPEGQQRDIARNVFAAKQTSNDDIAPPNRKWLLPMLASIIVVIGFGGWHVWNEVNKFGRPMPQLPQTAARPSAIASLPPAALTTGQVATVGTTKVEPAPPTEPSLPPLLPAPAKEAPVSVVARAMGAGGPPLTEQQALAKALKDAPVSKEAPIALQATNAANLTTVNPLLLRAYSALAAGNFNQAKQLYSEAVASTPQNVDAHLGLATASGRLGDTALAVRHYREALIIDPRNGTAIVGLLTLSGTGNAGEIELRTLISRNPDAASLQFALGNLYSGQNRWVEAQQAYFEAFRLDSEAPDYVYNLAVSLDHLRQFRLAQTYYQQALNLHKNAAGQFDNGAVTKRIQELSRESAAH